MRGIDYTLITLINELKQRVQLMERVLDVAIAQMRTPEEVQTSARETREAIAEFGRLVDAGTPQLAARYYRDLFSVTWDEAHAAAGGWQSSKLEALARRLELQRWLDSKKPA